MLYVFHVDEGHMMALDMSLTTENVETLKYYIEKMYGIPAFRQVLLISGGQCLDHAKKVCSYSSGTDTNPIFLFCNPQHSLFPPQNEVLDFREDVELLERVRKYAELPPSFQAVNKRAQLGQQISERGTSLLRTCEILALDQHNQHQGWAAVLANLDDVVAEFKSQVSHLEFNFNEYLKERDHKMQFLERFRDSLRILRKIPIHPKLLKIDTRTKYLTENSETCQGISGSELDEPEAITYSLFDWIGKDEHGNDLEAMYENCFSELRHYDSDKFQSLCTEVAMALSETDRPNMRKIEGLGPRLFGLDLRIEESKKIVKVQNELATAFSKHQNQVLNLNDSSVLPDLCASHINQLNVMAEKHTNLVEIRQMFDKARQELNKKLRVHLDWVIRSQNILQQVGIKIDVFLENIANLRYRLTILEQVDIAPVAYLSGLAEVVRRRSFSQAFLVWASELACRLLIIHNEEITKRKDFQSKYEDHFIQGLFPGMGDLPSSYGVDAPSHFDTDLPKLTPEDLEFIKKEVPEFEKFLNLGEYLEAPYFLSLKCLSNIESEEQKENPSSETVLKDAENQSEVLEKSIFTEGGSLMTLHGLPHLKDLDRGCESETDTEEFEKVGQSPMELNFNKDISSPRPYTQDVATLTEDTLEISKSEYDKLKSSLFKMSKAASQSLVQLKSDLVNIKEQYSIDESIIKDQLQKVNNSFKHLCDEQVNHERLLVDRMAVNHSTQISDLHKIVQVKEEKIKCLMSRTAYLEKKIKKNTEELAVLKENETINVEEIMELRDRVKVLESDRDKCLKEVTERLSREHKDEIKTLKARFKLMTMERSPSDSYSDNTLEFSSLTNHESLINQLTENFEVEKEKAVKETLANETIKWEKVIKKMKEEFEAEKNFLLSNLTVKVDVDRNEKTEVVVNKATELNPTSETDVFDSILNLELQENKNERMDMAASVAFCQEGRTDSTVKHRKSLSRSFSISAGKGNKVCVDSLKQGDYVVIVWDEEHENFKVVQDSSAMYFLHSDSVAALNLVVSEGPPKKPSLSYCIGEYVDKEYCYAKKSNNRYNVPKGTRFFRVKVKPLERSRAHHPSPEIDIPIARSHSHRTSSGSTTEPEFHSLPSSPKIKLATKPVEKKLSESRSDKSSSEVDHRHLTECGELPLVTQTCDFASNSDVEGPVCFITGDHFPIR